MAAPTTKPRPGDTPTRTWRELRHEWLFGREEEVPDLADDLDLAEQISNGLAKECLLIPTDVFGFQAAEVLYWIDTHRFSSLAESGQDREAEEFEEAFAEWVRGSKALSPEISDELASVLRVLAKTQETFGEIEKAKRWLSKPNKLLRGKKPSDLLDTEAGRQAVEKVLIRIGHGVFS